MKDGQDRAWVEIDLDGAAHNMGVIRRIVGPSTIVMAVVKANAYGHGMVEMSRVFLQNGSDRLAVACLDEAVHLRKNGIGAPIQVLGLTPAERMDEALDYSVIQTLSDMDTALALSRTARMRKTQAAVHVKLDTGMGRMGFQCNEETERQVVQIVKMAGLYVEGIMTHFASADRADPEYTVRQYRLFAEQCDILRGRDLDIPIRHASNSAAILNFPGMHLDMVRPGIALYGLYARYAKLTNIGFMPVMKMKARIVHIKRVDEGSYIGYGSTYRTNKKSLIVTISAGYADGYTRLMSNGGRVMINGEYAPIVGTICMDSCMVDVTELRSGIRTGQEVVLYGGATDQDTAINEIASKYGILNYEIPCGIGLRVPRVYSGKMFEGIERYI